MLFVKRSFVDSQLEACAYRARQLPLAQKSAQNLVPIFGTKPIFTLVPIIGTRQVKNPRTSVQPPYPLKTACDDEHWSYQFLTMSTNTTISLSNAVVLTAVAQGALAVSHFLLLEEDEFKQKRARRTTLQQRCRWDRFVFFNHDRPMFRRHLRMTYNSFLVLLDKIRPHLPVIDEKMAALRGGVIIPELRLYATIRYLVGGPPSLSSKATVKATSTSPPYSVASVSNRNLSAWRKFFSVNRVSS